MDKETTVAWKEGTPYSDRILFSGFAYKTIRMFNERDPSFGLSVAVSSSQSDCPGKRGKCLSALVIVANEGTARFDVQPERFECRCNDQKHHLFSYYRIPDDLRRVAPPGALFMANTVIPGESTKGIVYFSGSCADYVAIVPIEVSKDRTLLFAFPFSLSAH